MAVAESVIYALQGGGQNGFWKFDPQVGTWSVLDETPQGVSDGGALAAADGFIYAFRGDQKRDFWRYGVSNGQWEILPAHRKTSNGMALSLGMAPARSTRYAATIRTTFEPTTYPPAHGPTWPRRRGI